MNRLPRRGTGLRRALTAGLALGITLGVATSANAAFPGANGKIAYVKTLEGGNFEIFTANPDGSGETNITNNTGIDNSPDWSPDGSKIAHTRQSPSEGLYIMDADGSNPTLVPNTAGFTDTSLVSNVSWSPDGTKIAFGGIDRIRVINADGSGRIDVGPVGGDTGMPEWSPDGTKIVFRRAEDDPNLGDIWIMNADGTGAANLTNTPAENETTPDFSPDGTRIIFQEASLFLSAMNTDGSGRVLLRDETSYGPAFSPDGTLIASGDGANLRTVTATGSGPVNLVAGSTRQHDWQPVEAVDPPDLLPPGVGKTAVLSGERDISWEVLKSANLAGAGWDKKDSSVAVRYRVEVNRRLGPVRNVKVSGVVLITNQNPVPITVTGVEDSLPGGTCTTGPAGEIGANNSRQVFYSCDLPGMPEGPLTNTVTVSWSANGQAGVPVQATEPVVIGGIRVNGPPSVMVTDTLDGDSTRVLAEELGESRIFRYTRYLRASKKCVTYHNTARLLTVGDMQIQGASEVPVRPVMVDKDHAGVSICPPAPETPGDPKDPKDPPVVIVDNGDGKAPAPVPTKPADNPKGPVVTDPKGSGKMTVTKRANTRRAVVGDTVIWSITVRNTGKADLTDVVLTDRLPRHLRVIDNAKAPLAKGAKPNNRVIRVGVGDLLVGQSVTIRVATRVVGRPVLTPVIMRETAKAKDRDIQRTRARRGITCNVVVATADNARDRGAVSCIRITRPEREDGPVNPT